MRNIIKKRTAKILKCLGGIVITLAMIYGVMMASANHALNRAVEALKTDGRPMTRKEIVPLRIPDPDNAALIYEGVVFQLKAEEVGGTSLWDALGKAAAEVLSESPSTDALENFRQLYDRPVVTKALTDVEAGSRKPGYWNDLDYEGGVKMVLPHYQYLFNLSRILCAGVRLQAEAGDHATAWDSALTALRVANAVKDEPVTIMQLVRLAQFGMAMDAIQGLPYSDAVYQKIDGLLRVCEDSTPLANAIDGERILFGDSFFRAPKYGRTRTLQMVRMLVADESEPGTRLEWLYVQPYVLLSPLFKRDYAAHQTALHAHARHLLESRFPADRKFDKAVLEKVPRYCLLTQIVLPAISHAKANLISRTAQARVIRSGLAVLKERAAQGTWPEALPAYDDLADPFTGNPLIYQPSPQGFVLYSVGKDLVDDNGTKEENGKGDIVWRYSEE